MHLHQAVGGDRGVADRDGRLPGHRDQGVEEEAVDTTEEEDDENVHTQISNIMEKKIKKSTKRLMRKKCIVIPHEEKRNAHM